MIVSPAAGSADNVIGSGEHELRLREAVRLEALVADPAVAQAVVGREVRRSAVTVTSLTVVPSIVRVPVTLLVRPVAVLSATLAKSFSVTR